MAENDDSGAEIETGSTELFGVEVSGCESCNTLMVGTERTCNKCKEKVPVEELQALVDRWEQGMSADKACAKELQEVIDDNA